MNRRVRVGLFLSALVLWASSRTDTLANPPWQRMSLFSKVDADPDKEYPLTEDSGPWVIMAATFSGEGAQEQAKELVQELRSRHHLPAYTHDMTFDFSRGTNGRGIDRYGQPLRMRYQRELIHEHAVLVGDFDAVDDPQAQKVLKKLKYLKPECLDLKKRVQDGKKESRSLAAFRIAQQVVQDVAQSSKKDKGPMGHAFVTTNPLLPDEYFAPKGVDKFVLSINKKVKYSLLDCPGRYTCVVATFTGGVLIDQQLIQDVEEGRGKMGSQLAEAADKAHKLTEALRAKGVEAYEFHDRNASLVAVGSFDQLKIEAADGNTQIHPQLAKLMSTYGAARSGTPEQKVPAIRSKSLEGIPFDVNPYPVEVPRRSISADYDRSLSQR